MFHLGRHLRSVAAQSPDAAMLEFEHRWWTWRDLTTWMDRIHDALAATSIGPGHAVGILLRNRPESVGALAAVLGSDRCVVTLNPATPDGALAAELDRLDLGVVLVAGPDLERTAVVDHARATGIMLEARGIAITPTGCQRPDPRRRPGIAVEMLTSGTTGPPKRVPLPYDRLLRSVAGAVHDGPRLRTGSRIVWAPLAHIGGLWGAISTLAEGRRLSLLARFEVSTWVERVKEHRPIVTGLPPTGMRMLLDAGIAPEDLSSLRAVTVGTAPASPELIEEFEDAFGIPALITYGATEFAGGVACWTLDLHQQYRGTKRGSVGRAMHGIELRIVDADGGVLPTGERGLLEVRGDALGSDWIHTSDRAWIDEDGFLFIEGRADDAIIRGGFKVSAGEVAAALETIPGVRRAGVVGLPDARLGEVPVAAVEVETASLDADSVLALLRDRVVPYQVPVSLHVVPELPTTATLKVDAVALREMIVRLIEEAST